MARMRHVFPAWLVLFYGSWVAIVLTTGSLTLMLEHWPMAGAMALGSYFAGSTPMGGGTVGFPVLVLLMDSATALGRDFSFAVQSAGMTSAAIYIVATRQPVAWTLLGWSVLGTCVGTPLGLTLLAPAISEAAAKLTFAVAWASFGVLTLSRLRTLSRQTGMLNAPIRVERWTGFLTGLLGGAVVASVTGVGVDMVFYVVLVLARRGDARLAIPTSVILMATTSLVGTAWQTFALDGLHRDVFGNWLAAAPVVVLGAPLGALVATRIGRVPTLVVVSLLCLVQFAWTLQQQANTMDLADASLVAAAALGVTGTLVVLIRWGDHLASQCGLPEGLHLDATGEAERTPRHSGLRSNGKGKAAA